MTMVGRMSTTLSLFVVPAVSKWLGSKRRWIIFINTLLESPDVL